MLPKERPTATLTPMTTKVNLTVSFLVGQTTLLSSDLTSCKKINGLTCETMVDIIA